MYKQIKYNRETKNKMNINGDGEGIKNTKQLSKFYTVCRPQNVTKQVLFD